MNNDKHPLQDILDGLGYTCRSYSGRGMCGKYCLGVELRHNSETLGQFVSTVMVDIVEQIDSQNDNSVNYYRDVAEAFENIAIDSLGKGSIVYFPDVSFAEEELVDDE